MACVIVACPVFCQQNHIEIIKNDFKKYGEIEHIFQGLTDEYGYRSWVVQFRYLYSGHDIEAYSSTLVIIKGFFVTNLEKQTLINNFNEMKEKYYEAKQDFLEMDLGKQALINNLNEKYYAAKRDMDAEIKKLETIYKKKVLEYDILKTEISIAKSRLNVVTDKLRKKTQDLKDATIENQKLKDINKGLNFRIANLEKLKKQNTYRKFVKNS